MILQETSETLPCSFNKLFFFSIYKSAITGNISYIPPRHHFSPRLQHKYVLYLLKDALLSTLCQVLAGFFLLVVSFHFTSLLSALCFCSRSDKRKDRAVKKKKKR